MATATQPTRPDFALPSTLVAIARAARLTGDHDLEREAVIELRERWGIILGFAEPRACVAAGPEAARG